MLQANCSGRHIIQTQGGQLLALSLGMCILYPCYRLIPQVLCDAGGCVTQTQDGRLPRARSALLRRACSSLTSQCIMPFLKQHWPTTKQLHQASYWVRSAKVCSLAFPPGFAPASYLAVLCLCLYPVWLGSSFASNQLASLRFCSGGSELTWCQCVRNRRSDLI